MKKILVIAIFMIVPFLSKAQLPPIGGNVQHGIIISYPNGKYGGGGLGTLRVSNNLGATHDYTTYPSDYIFMSSTSFTLDWCHTFFYGWGNRVRTINKSTFDAMAYGASMTINNVYHQGDYYKITKGYGYSIIGTTYDYTISIVFYSSII